MINIDLVNFKLKLKPIELLSKKTFAGPHTHTQSFLRNANRILPSNFNVCARAQSHKLNKINIMRIECAAQKVVLETVQVHARV